MTTPLITAPGVYAGIPNDVYHGREEICPAPSISSTGIKTILGETPRHYYHGSGLNPVPPIEKERKSKALGFGGAAHDWVLEGDAAFLAKYEIVDDDWDRRSNARKEQEAEAIAAGRAILKHGELDQIRAMKREIEASIAGPMLVGSQRELTMAWIDRETGVWCRVLYDAIHLPRPAPVWMVPDYKTAESGAPDDFARAINNFGYHISAAMYLEGCEHAHGDRPDVWLWCVQEKAEPFDVAVYQCDSETLEYGRLLFRRGLRKFADCLASGRWPGRGEQIRVAGLPEYERIRLAKQHEKGEFADCYPDKPNAPTNDDNPPPLAA